MVSRQAAATIEHASESVDGTAGPDRHREQTGTVRFGSFELDFDRYELRLEDRPVALEPRTFDLVALLARNRGRTVTRDEILDEVWQGQVVSDAALSSQVRSARKALGDDGKRQAVIATVHGRGFRLRKGIFETEDVPDIPAISAGRFDRNPCVAVLPCAAPGDDERGALIAGGVTEDLINALSRNRWMRVVIRNSAFALGRSGEPLDEILQRLKA